MTRDFFENFWNIDETDDRVRELSQSLYGKPPEDLNMYERHQVSETRGRERVFKFMLYLLGFALLMWLLGGGGL